MNTGTDRKPPAKAPATLPMDEETKNVILKSDYTKKKPNVKGKDRKQTDERPKRTLQVIANEAVAKIKAKHNLFFYMETFHLWNGEIYAPCRNREMEKLVRKILGEEDLTTRNKEVIRQLMLDTTVPDPSEIDPPHLLALKDRILNLNTLEGFAFHPKHKITSRIPVSYDPSAVTEKWDRFLLRVLGEDVELFALLAQFFGYCLTPDCSQHKALILEGPGANGKSVVLAVLEAMLGPENCLALSVDEISGDQGRFNLVDLVGKKANICDEIGKSTAIDDGMVKRIIAGDRIKVEEKYQKRQAARITAKLIFATNNFPYSRDHTPGLFRRIMILPFKVQIPEEERNLHLAQEIIDNELDGVFQWALRGLQSLRAEGKFDEPAAVVAKGEEFKRHVDHVLRFFDDCVERTGKAERYHDNLGAFKRAYDRWAEDEGIAKKRGKNQLGKDIENYFGVEPKMAMPGKIYPGVGLKSEVKPGESGGEEM